MASTYYNGKFTEYPSSEEEFDKWLNEIKIAFEMKNKCIQHLENENKTLRDEKWKDNELQDMKKTYEAMRDDYYRGFPISKKEKDAIYKWQENHLINQHGLNTPVKRALSGGVIGGNFKYQFIPTSIGTMGTCICGSCFAKAKKEYEEKKADETFLHLLEKYDAEFIFQNMA